MLETNIYPIHKLLQKWKQVHENIDQTMNSIGKVLDIFDTPQKVEERIMDGTRGDYPAYLACLDQVFIIIFSFLFFLSFSKTQ